MTSREDVPGRLLTPPHPHLLHLPATDHHEGLQPRRPEDWAACAQSAGSDRTPIRAASFYPKNVRTGLQIC